ncbi:SRPBCC family protein [Streptomyces hypolithicus]
MAPRSVVVRRRIEATPELVWPALTDLREMPHVLSGVSKVEVLAPADGRFGVGTRWRETRRMMGTQATEEMRVTACEAPLRYVVEAQSRGTHYVSEFVLAAAGPAATDVTMTFSAAPPDSGVGGLLAKVFTGVGAKAVGKAVAKDLADVAAHVEARHG